MGVLALRANACKAMLSNISGRRFARREGDREEGRGSTFNRNGDPANLNLMVVEDY